MNDSAVEAEGEDWNEAFKAQIPRNDLVGMAANGVDQWLVMKQDGPGLLDPSFVRQLITKAEGDPAATHAQGMVTVTASPAAMAALIHGAPVRKADAAPQTYEQLVKAKYNADDLKRMSTSGAAMENGSYPIADKDDLGRAIRAVGRGGASHDAIRHHIITRAKSLGASSEIPDTWNTDGSLKKATEDDGMDDTMDPGVLLAEPDQAAPGNPAEPGSPAWEATDAATARKWTGILARARAALELMSDRENLEAASADPDDAEAACDLQDAACAIDYAISILAPFAVDEQSEADCRDDEMSMIGKALSAFDIAPLEILESLAPVRKAGRVLSSANEAAIRGAVESLQKVLASLPAAPTAEDTDGGQAVAKTANEEPDMPEPTLTTDVTADSGQAPAMGVASPAPQPVAGAAVTDVAKADGDSGKAPMVAVYDADGNLVGIVDPTEITPIRGAKGNGPNAGDDAEDSAPAAPPADLTPAPSAEAGTPADEVEKTSAETPADSTTMLKSSDITAMVKAAIAEHSAPQGELIKSLEDRNRALEERNEELTKTVGELADRVKTVENQPAVMAIAGHGAVPASELLRGQDQGGNVVQLTKAQELRKQLASATDAATQERIKREMNELAVAQLGVIHQHGAAH